jgi:SAM-dependent methyltransferase
MGAPQKPPMAAERAPRQAFDRAAASYDAEAEANLAMRHMRAVSLRVLRKTFAPGQRLLEVGCGTGEEALALARHGCTVLATDISPEMVALTRAKVEAAGLTDQVETLVLGAHGLAQLAGEPFDGAYSSFGPLNGVADLRPALAALGALVRPGGRIVLSVMNRWYPLEIGWFLLHGRPRMALRRLRRVEASVSTVAGERMTTHYHSLRALRQAARPWFAVRRCQALPLLLPPPYMASLWSRRPRLVTALQRWEPRLAARWPCYAWGDHWLVVLERVADEAEPAWRP